MHLAPQNPTKIQTPVTVLTNIVLIAVSASLVHIAFLPLGFDHIVLIAFIPFLMVIQGASYSVRFVSGLILGAFIGIDIPMALASWRPIVTYGPWVLLSVLLGVCSLLSGVLQRRLKASYQFLVFSVVWVIVMQASALVTQMPMTLAVAYATESPQWLGIIRIIGTQGFDLIALSFSGLIAALLKKQLAILSGICWAFVLLLILWAGAHSSVKSTVNTFPISAIQPSISWGDYKAAKWSLYERDLIETRLDQLTMEALQTRRSLIIWPEGGNELYNLRLPRRQSIFDSMLKESDSEFLIGGKDLDFNGKKANVVHYLNKEGFVGLAKKNKTVPFVEYNLTRGEATVFDTGFGKIGTSICFESVFQDHALDLVKQGAQVIVAITDDSSFGKTNFATIHLAYSILRSMEVNRPLVFLSNNGPTVSTDAAGNII